MITKHPTSGNSGLKITNVDTDKITKVVMRSISLAIMIFSVSSIITLYNKYINLSRQ